MPTVKKLEATAKRLGQSTGVPPKPKKRLKPQPVVEELSESNNQEEVRVSSKHARTTKTKAYRHQDLPANEKRINTLSTQYMWDQLFNKNTFPDNAELQRWIEDAFEWGRKEAGFTKKGM